MFGRSIYFILFCVAVAAGIIAGLHMGGDMGDMFKMVVDFGDAFIRHAVPVLVFAALMKYTLKK